MNLALSETPLSPALSETPEDRFSHDEAHIILHIGPDKQHVYHKVVIIFLPISCIIVMFWVLKIEIVFLSTNNICFGCAISKIIFKYTLLSGE